MEVGDVVVGQGIVGREQRAAEAGDGRELVGVAQRQVDGAVAAHRQAGDRPAGAARDGAEAGVDRGQEIVDQRSLPGALAGRVVDIPAVAGPGRDDDERECAHVVGDAAGVEPIMMTAVGAVEQQQHRVAAVRVLVIAVGQDDGAGYRLPERRAGDVDVAEHSGLDPVNGKGGGEHSDEDRPDGQPRCGHRRMLPARLQVM